MASAEYQRKWRAEHPEKIVVYKVKGKPYEQEYYKAHREQNVTRKRRWRRLNPARSRAMVLLGTLRGLAKIGGYAPPNITIDEYLEREANFKGICEVPGCGEIIANYRRRHLEHSHVTGVVRGFVCPRCNMLIGALEDPKFPLIQAFLDSWEAKEEPARTQ